MKVHELETFEGIMKPLTGLRGRPSAQQIAKASDQVKIHALPGGAYVVDWGAECPGNTEGVLALVGAANVKGAVVSLTDEEKAKLLK